MGGAFVIFVNVTHGYVLSRIPACRGPCIPRGISVGNWVTCSFFEMTDSDDQIKKEIYYHDRSSVIKQPGG